MHLSRDSVSFKDDCSYLYLDRLDKVHLPDKYSPCSDEFGSVLTKLQLMWDRRLGRIELASHHIKLVHKKMQSAHSPQWCGGPKSEEFKKIKIEKASKGRKARTDRIGNTNCVCKKEP